MSKKTVPITQQKRDRTNESFAKCVKTVMKKSNKLKGYRANAYLLIYRMGDSGSLARFRQGLCRLQWMSW